MNDFLQYAFVALPWVVALIIPMVMVTWVVVGARSAALWVMFYFVFLFSFPNASWGLVETTAGTNFYTRGTGTFFFSVINLLLFGVALQAFVIRRLGTLPPAPHNLKVPVYIFGALLLGNLVVGMALPKVYWFQLLSPSGLMNIVNLMLAFYAMTTCLADRKPLERFVNLLLLVVVLRGLWGLARFAALGGDPANFYANFQHINVRITFFDINDSLLATLALFLAAWRLLTGQAQTLAQRCMYIGIALLELFIIVFSYRRTAWIGLALAMLLLAFSVKRVHRLWLLASYVLMGLPLMIYKLVQRGGVTAHSGDLLEKILPDVVSHGSLNFTTGRFAELYAALLSMRESPIWGLGAWGYYDGFRFSDLAWHRGDFTWMHSGVLHIALKTGLIGVTALVLVFFGFFRFVARNSAHLEPRERGVLLAGAAGMLFMVPTILFGTPVIEYRAMQLLALTFALPYCAVAAANKRG
jgi:hypothetical protein